MIEERERKNTYRPRSRGIRRTLRPGGVQRATQCGKGSSVPHCSETILHSIDRGGRHASTPVVHKEHHMDKRELEAIESRCTQEDMPLCQPRALCVLTCARLWRAWRRVTLRGGEKNPRTLHAAGECFGPHLRSPLVKNHACGGEKAGLWPSAALNVPVWKTARRRAAPCSCCARPGARPCWAGGSAP